jgi:hypothetical protein
MFDLEQQTKFFRSFRLFPDIPRHRLTIHKYFASMKLEKDPSYDHYLAKYEEMAKERGVPLFGDLPGVEDLTSGVGVNDEKNRKEAEEQKETEEVKEVMKKKLGKKPLQKPFQPVTQE